MGFLDFLKKKNPDVPPPPDVSSIDINAVEQKLGLGSNDFMPEPAPLPPPEAMQYDDVPVPPPQMMEPAVEEQEAELSVSQDDFMPPVPVQKKPLIEEPAPTQESKPKQTPPKPTEKKPRFDLPDFTDEPEKPKVEQPEQPREKPKQEPKAPREEPIIEVTPEQQDDVKPLETHPAFKQLEHATFMSSTTYFDLAQCVRDVRSLLRDNDAVLKDAVADHAQGDEQLESLAAELNAMQERYAQLDRALFEE